MLDDKRRDCHYRSTTPNITLIPIAPITPLPLPSLSRVPSPSSWSLLPSLLDDTTRRRRRATSSPYSTLMMILIMVCVLLVTPSLTIMVDAANNHTIPPPTVTESHQSRAIGARTISITGTYWPQHLFPSVTLTPPLKNVTIEWIDCSTRSNDTTLRCTMLLEFQPIPMDHLGSTLFAQVHVDDQSSEVTPIAMIVDAALLFPATVALETGSRSLELQGRFFSREPVFNRVCFYGPNGVMIAGSVAGVDSTATALTVRLDPPARPPNLGPLEASVELFGATSLRVQVATIVLAEVDSTSTLVCGGTTFSPLPVVFGDAVQCVIYIQGNGDKRVGEEKDFTLVVQDHQGPGHLGEITATLLSEDLTEIRFTYQSPTPASGSSSSQQPSSESIVVRSVSDGSNVLGSPVVIEFVAGRRSGLSFWEQNRDWIIVTAVLAAVITISLVFALGALSWYKKRKAMRSNLARTAAALAAMETRLAGLSMSMASGAMMTTSTSRSSGAHGTPQRSLNDDDDHTDPSTQLIGGRTHHRLPGDELDQKRAINSSTSNSSSGGGSLTSIAVDPSEDPLLARRSGGYIRPTIPPMMPTTAV